MCEVKTHEITRRLARNFEGLFPGRDLQKPPHTIVTLALQTTHRQSAMTSEMLSERQEGFQRLLDRMKVFHEHLHSRGHWCDYIDPSSGAPWHTPSSTTFIECDERYRSLGYEILELGCCRAVASKKFGQCQVMTSAFVQASPEALAEALPLLEVAPGQAESSPEAALEALGEAVSALEIVPKQVAILGMGNPLLDISDNVDRAMLDKYGLEPGGIILAEEKHQPLFAEMASRPGVQYIAGGATQNSIRVAQWMLQVPSSTAYMGCVGKDEFADKMKASCEADGVKTYYMVDSSTPTGSCAVLIEGIERSLCTNLMAANNFQVDHINKADNLKIVEEAKIIYSAGFFITVSTDSMRLAAAAAAKSGAKYCLNLSAPFLMQVPPFKAFILEILPMVDYLFCNETEAATFAETEAWDTADISFIATRLSLIPMAKRGHRTVIITQGCEPTVVAFRGHVTKHPILVLPKEKLVDTNGAGDAYVGGFLAALSKGLKTADCCKAGAYSASVIVQHSGCTFPAAPDYDL